MNAAAQMLFADVAKPTEGEGICVAIGLSLPLLALIVILNWVQGFLEERGWKEPASSFAAGCIVFSPLVCILICIVLVLIDRFAPEVFASLLQNVEHLLQKVEQPRADNASVPVMVAAFLSITSVMAMRFSMSPREHGEDLARQGGWWILVYKIWH